MISFVKYLVSAYNYNLDFGTSAVDLKKKNTFIIAYFELYVYFSFPVW